jgi:hypothetical protein
VGRVRPGEKHRDEIVELMRVTYNFSPGPMAERTAWLPIPKMRCIADGERIVAAAGARLPAAVRRGSSR